MKRIILLLLIAVLVGIIFTNVRRERRFSAPSTYDYQVADSIDVHYYDPQVVLTYLESANRVGQIARSLWREHRLDVRFHTDLSVEEHALIQNYWKTKALAQHTEVLLRQSWHWKQAGFNNAEIERLAKEGISPTTMRFEKVYGPIQELPWRIGSRGDHVTLLQQSLVALGYTIPIDGTYGDQTRDAVKDMQLKIGELPTGVPTQHTLQNIFEPK